MSVDLAVVRLPYLPGHGPIRTGLVLVEDEDLYLVRWDDDGSEEEIYLGDFENVVPRDSVRYLALVERLNAVFVADPMSVVLRVLAASGTPMNVAAIRTYLAGLGLDMSAWSSRWSRAQKSLSTHEGVICVGVGSARTYRWTGGDLPETQASTGDSLADGGGSTQPDRKAVEELAAATAAEPVSESGKPEPAELSSEEAVATSAVEVPAAAPTEEPVAARPSEETPACVPEPVNLTLAELLEAVAERLRATEGLTPEQTDPLVELLRRCAAAGDELPAPVLPELVRVASAVAASEAAHLDVVESIAPRIAQLLRRSRVTAQTSVDVDELARMTGRLPLSIRGGRVAVLQAINAVWPERVVEPRWWTGVTLAELADAARGALGGVTARADVAEQVVRPLMLREAGVAATFARVAELLTMPREFVAQIPPEIVASAFRRAAADDRMVASWLRALAGSERIEALEEEISKARAKAVAAEESVLTAQNRAEELAERCKVLEDTLHIEHTEAIRLRSAQDRQIRIDAIRALATLAAEVEELATENTASATLVQRVRDLAAAAHLEAVGSAGEESAFDPNLHEPIVGSPESGTPITVIRPGYQWRPDGDDILLDKALVTTT